MKVGVTVAQQRVAPLWVWVALALGLAITLVPNVTSLLLMTLAAWVPVALAGIGEVLNQRGGVFNIGIEGMMLIGTFTGVLGADLTHSWLGGLLGGVLAGVLVGCIFGSAVTYGRANQTIAGLGLNFVALGGTAFGIFMMWSQYMFRRVPDAERVPALITPWGSFRWMALLTLLATAVVVAVLHHTRFGMRLRAVGHNARTADVSGIDVYRTRLVASLAAGALAGLAGAYLSVDWVGLTSMDVVAGRGFVALACVVFSGLNPWRVLSAAFVFSFFNALGLWLQVVPWAKGLMGRGGNFLFLMLPYLAVLALLVLAPSRERFPREMGRPYART
jgi:ABC-type uncharacterized transport system permease subunit